MQLPSTPPLWRRLLVPAVLALVAFCFSAVGGAGLLSRAFAKDDTPLTRASPSDDRVALTFDVTFGQEELAKLLPILESHGVHATFFVGGTFLSTGAETVRQLAARGHEIGTLGQKIVDLSRLPEQEVTSNLLASQSLLSKALGAPVRYFRPPLGIATGPVVRGARAADLVTVTFSLDAADQVGRPAKEVAKRIVKRARRGDIIRLTASDFAGVQTSGALPLILQGLKEKGFKVVTVSELVVP